MIIYKVRNWKDSVPTLYFTDKPTRQDIISTIDLKTKIYFENILNRMSKKVFEDISDFYDIEKIEVTVNKPILV